MRVKRFVDPGEFLAASAWIASRGESSASISRSIAYALERSQVRAEETIYLATCGRAGVAVRRGHGPVVLGQSDEAAAEAFADDLAGEMPGLSGVVGALRACEAFARRWHRRTGREGTLCRHMRQHVLAKVAEVPDVPGASRIAQESELRVLVDAQRAFVAEVGLSDPPARIRASLLRRVARGEIRVWDDQGPAAYAGFIEAAPALARIAPVYTWPARRRRGYGTALVAALSRELMAQGKERLFLTTDAANPTPNAMYARIGFVPETDEYQFDFVEVGR